MGLVQLNYTNSNQDLINTYTIFISNILAILFTHTRQLTSPFSISQLSINTDESSFKHFIKHLVGVRENSKFPAQQVRLRSKLNQLAI